MQDQLDLHGFQSNLLHRNRPTFGNLAVHMVFSTRLSRAASSRADGGCAANGSNTPSGHADHRPEQGPDRPAIRGDSTPRRTGHGRPTDGSGGTLNYETAHWHSPVDGHGGRQRPMGADAAKRSRRRVAKNGCAVLRAMLHSRTSAHVCGKLARLGPSAWAMAVSPFALGETAWRMSDALP